MADRWICSRQMTHSPVCSSDSSVLSASAQVQDDGNGAGCLSGAAGTLVAGGLCAARASRSGCGGGIASCRAPASPQPLGRHAARRSISPPKTMATVTGSIQGCSLKSNVVSANRLSLVLNSSATSEGGNALSIPPGCTIALMISPWRPPTAIAARSMTLSKPAQSRRTSSGASCCIYFAARRAGVCVFTRLAECVHASLCLSPLLACLGGEEKQCCRTQQTKRARVRLVRLCKSLSPWEDQEIPIHAPVTRAC